MKLTITRTRAVFGYPYYYLVDNDILTKNEMNETIDDMRFNFKNYYLTRPEAFREYKKQREAKLKMLLI